MDEFPPRSKTISSGWAAPSRHALSFYFVRLYYALIGLLEFLKFTPLIGALQGRVGPWSVAINVLLGVDAAASYARIDRQPGKRKVRRFLLAFYEVHC